ncbi:MAG: hypothetical protein ABJ327_21940 [Litoreibacter sp.]
MSSYKTEVKGLTYNAAAQCFEAMVIFHEAGETIKYPCSLTFPIDTDFQKISQGLVRAAKIKRAANRHGLVSRTRAHLASELKDIRVVARQLALHNSPRAA